MNRADQSKTVTVNCRVTIQGFEPGGDNETYWIVEDREANLRENRLGSSSPLANALIGASVGDTVPYHPPVGRVELTIVDVVPV